MPGIYGNRTDESSRIAEETSEPVVSESSGITASEDQLQTTEVVETSLSDQYAQLVEDVLDSAITDGAGSKTDTKKNVKAIEKNIKDELKSLEVSKKDADERAQEAIEKRLGKFIREYLQELAEGVNVDDKDLKNLEKLLFKSAKYLSYTGSLLQTREDLELVNQALEDTKDCFTSLFAKNCNLVSKKDNPCLVNPSAEGCTPPEETCPPGTTGTPPNCTPTPETCPPGTTGTPPNCTPTEQPPVGSTGGTFRDPNNPEEACSSLLGTGRQEGFYDDCLNEDLSRCPDIDPFDNSVCDTWVVVGGYDIAEVAGITDSERVGGNEFLISCSPGFEPVIIGYSTEFRVEPIPILDCQPVS